MCPLSNFIHNLGIQISIWVNKKKLQKNTIHVFCNSKFIEKWICCGDGYLWFIARTLSIKIIGKEVFPTWFTIVCWWPGWPLCDQSIRKQRLDTFCKYIEAGIKWSIFSNAVSWKKKQFVDFYLNFTGNFFLAVHWQYVITGSGYR